MWPQGWTPEDTARPAWPRCGGERAALSLKVLPSRFLPRAHLLQLESGPAWWGSHPEGHNGRGKAVGTDGTSFPVSWAVARTEAPGGHLRDALKWGELPSAWGCPHLCPQSRINPLGPGWADGRPKGRAERRSARVRVAADR